MTLSPSTRTTHNQWTRGYVPNRNNQALIDAVYQLRFADQEMLTKLLAFPGDGVKRGFTPSAIYWALRSLTNRGFLRLVRKYARLQHDLARTGWRHVYALDDLGFGALDIPASVGYRNDLHKIVATFQADETHDRVPHDLMVSRFHAFLLKGQAEGLWSFRWKQGKKQTEGYGLIPDAMAIFRLPTGKDFTLFIEAERRNPIHKTIAHMRKYHELFKEKKAAVLFLTKQETKAERFQQECFDIVGANYGSMMRFLAEDTYDTDPWKPAEFLKPKILSSRAKQPLVALLPSQES